MGNAATSPFSPFILWDLYITYLWNYHDESWVASIASTFRVLAFLIVTPFVILMLLDVTSYVIARTLGVIDDTKASTSEVLVPSGPLGETDIDITNNNNNDNNNAPPSILVQDTSSVSVTPSESDSTTHTPPTTINIDTIEPNPKLAGVNVFSPAPSQPPSPTLSRRDLSESLRMTSVHPNAGEERERKAGRKHAPSVSSTGSSGESSYALVVKDSELEEEDGAYMRRRFTTGPEAVSD